MRCLCSVAARNCLPARRIISELRATWRAYSQGLPDLSRFLSSAVPCALRARKTLQKGSSSILAYLAYLSTCVALQSHLAALIYIFSLCKLGVEKNLNQVLK